MRQITIIVNAEFSGALDAHKSDKLDIQFLSWGGINEIETTGDYLWVFVDGTKDIPNALETCRRLRCMPQAANAHIVLTMGQNDEESRRQAKRAGANHCIASPISRQQMINMVTSFAWQDDQVGEAGLLEFGELVVDLPAFQARWMGKPIALMPNEFQLLKFFVEHPGRVYTRAQIISMLGRQREWVDERTVDAWVGRLRRRLKAAGAPETLRTVRSFGFILNQP